MTTGITGATGQLGRLVVEKLKQRVSASHLVALVRSPEKAQDLGVATRAFDYTKPQLLADGLQGIDQLLLISGSEIGQRKMQHQNIIEAAKKAGVKRIVYTSLLHADTSSLSLAGEHLETEKLLKESGIPYTVLRNGWYTENYTASVSAALAEGYISGSAGEGKISSATRADYAEAAVVVLTTDGHTGKVYELAGDNAYTLNDLATEISGQTNQHVVYKNLSEQDYVTLLKEKGLPDIFAQAIAGFDTGAAANDLFDDGKVLSGLIGRPTTPLSVAVKNALT